MIKFTIPILLAILMLPIMADDIVVKEVGGLPVIRTKIHYGDKQIEAQILFDLGSNIPMVIHEKCLGGLDLSPIEAEGKEVEIEFAGNGRWKAVPMQVQKTVPVLENLTRNFPLELDEVPVVAIVGLPVIKSNVVELDLRKGLLRTLGLASTEAQAVEMDYEDKSYGMVLQGTGPTDTPVKVQLTMSSEDSILDLSWLQAARKAGKSPNVLKLGDCKFSDQAAIRFQPLDETVAESIDAIIGVGALRNYTVTVWPKRSKIAFVPHPPVAFPQAVQEFFFALADKKPAGVAEFIRTSKPSRLMDEACIALLHMRLSEPSTTTELIQEAIETTGANYNLIRRSSTLASIADQLEKMTHPDQEKLVVLALDLAMKNAGKALDQTAAQAIHFRLGKRALASGDTNQARRHLLSAAFGMPKSGECNFWLGEVYLKMGKSSRAWSRYFQGLLDPRMNEERFAKLRADSLARLDELNRDPEFRKTFNMILAEQYMAGRLEDAEFHAPSRYALAKHQFSGHIKLGELFTNATDPASGGIQLAFQSLDEYFDGEVALIEYHLNDPMQSDIANHRLKYYDAETTSMAIFDGTTVLTPALSQSRILAEQAAENYPALRDACQLVKAVPDSGWTLDVKMAQDGMKVSGTIMAAGEGVTDTLRLHAILCERSVMAVESSLVFFHHFVARQALTPPDGLDLKSALEKPYPFAINAEKMREDLTQMLSGGGPVGSLSKPTYVDANKLMVVVFVQEQGTRRILAAKAFSLPQEEETL